MKPLIVLALCGASALHAAPVVDAALATTLVGGTVTVTRFGGVFSTAVFAPDGAGGAIAETTGSGAFKLAVSPGDTALATWTLTNTDSTPIFLNLITAATIDLTLSGVALFDDDTLPSTPDSGVGVGGVTHAGGTGIAAATEFLPWADAANLGDLFHASSIVFSSGLTALASSSWRDDTDRIGSVSLPSSLTLLGLALAALPLARGRRPAQHRPRS